MLTAVGDLLSDEGVDLAPEIRVGDLAAVVAYRVDEHLLAVGEEPRQRRHKVAT